MYDSVVKREKIIKYLGKSLDDYWSCEICKQGGKGADMFQVEFVSYQRVNSSFKIFVNSSLVIQVCKKCKEAFF